MIKIILGDAHEIVHMGMKELCKECSDMELADHATSAEELIEKIKQQEFDLVILDINVREKNTIDIINEIKNFKPDLPIIVYSMFPEENYAVRLIQTGASSYIYKANGLDDLIKAIRKVVNGGIYITSALAEQYAVSMKNRDNRTLHETLTNREFQIMIMLASGMSVNDIAKKLYLSKSTVSNHRHQILKKLKLKNSAEVSLYAVKTGLLLYPH